MATSLETNNVVVTRVHCNIIFIPKIIRLLSKQLFYVQVSQCLFHMECEMFELSCLNCTLDVSLLVLNLKIKATGQCGRFILYLLYISKSGIHSISGGTRILSAWYWSLSHCSRSSVHFCDSHMSRARTWCSTSYKRSWTWSCENVPSGHVRTAKALIRLRIRSVWSGSFAVCLQNNTAEYINA